MAFIFALLLLAGLGSIFSGWGNKINEWNRRSLEKSEEGIRLFFANLYVVTWQYYQQLEEKVILATKQYPSRKYIVTDYKEPFGFVEAIDLEDYTKKVYGTPIVDYCIAKAFNELRERGYPVYRPHPNAEIRGNYGVGFIKLGEKQAYNIMPDMFLYKLKMKNPGDYYDWASAENASGEFPRSCIPDETDLRTYYRKVFTVDIAGEMAYVYRENTPHIITSILEDLILLDHPMLTLNTL